LKKVLKNIFLIQNGIKEDKKPSYIYLINVLLVTILITGLFYFAFSQLDYNFRWKSVYKYKNKFITGFLTTLWISVFSLFLSLFIGIVVSLARKSKIIVFRILSRIYIEIIRGTPLLVQILIFFYVVADAFNLDNRYIAGIIIMSVFSGAYVAEMIRGGIESISETQIQSARSLGLTKFQIYIYVIFPQVIKRILPALAGQFASLIKDSSLLSIISVNELTLNAQEINAYTYSTLEIYMPLAIAYLVMTFPVSYLSKYLERKFQYES
jgi:polar amino acid transport system permease protein